MLLSAAVLAACVGRHGETPPVVAVLAVRGEAVVAVVHQRARGRQTDEGISSRLKERDLDSNLCECSQPKHQPISAITQAEFRNDLEGARVRSPVEGTNGFVQLGLPLIEG